MKKKDAHCQHEARFLTMDGGFRWFDVYARPVLDERGNIIGTIGTLNDITERRTAEEKLREQLHFNQMLIETLPNPMFFKDCDGRYLGVNKSWEGYFGVKREDCLGRRDADAGVDADFESGSDGLVTVGMGSRQKEARQKSEQHQPLQPLGSWRQRRIVVWPT